MNEDSSTLDYATPGAFRRRISRSALVVVAILLCAALAALIEYRPALVPQTGLLRGDRRAIPTLLVWLLAIVYIVQRSREDTRWPCAGLVLVAIAGAASLTLFAFQCILWREQLKYRDPSTAMTVLPFAGALGAFVVAAVGRRLTRQCSGPEPRVSFSLSERCRGAAPAVDRPYFIPQMAADDLFAKFPYLAPTTPGGLPKRQHIRRFTPDLFNDKNNHNPLVARTCPACQGQGWYRLRNPPLGDRRCEICGGIGSLEKAERFFRERSWWRKEAGPKEATPNAVGSVKCPACGRWFPVYSNQYWTGLRHDCGQKLKLVGPNADKCWTRRIPG